MAAVRPSLLQKN